MWNCLNNHFTFEFPKKKFWHRQLAACVPPDTNARLVTDKQFSLQYSEKCWAWVEQKKKAGLFLQQYKQKTK